MTIFLRYLLVGDTGKVTLLFLGTETLASVDTELNARFSDQGCILSPCLFNFYAEYIMRNAGLEEAQAGSPT